MPARSLGAAPPPDCPACHGSGWSDVDPDTGERTDAAVWPCDHRDAR